MEKPNIPLWRHKGFELPNGTLIKFGTGKKDNWGIFVKRECDGDWHMPLDWEYFTSILYLVQLYGEDLVYDSFCKVYSEVTPYWGIEERKRCYVVCKEVDSLFGEDDTLGLWIILFMSMVAEENYEGTKLGKNIKHLAVYNIVWEKYPISYVTGYVDSETGNRVQGYMYKPKGGWIGLKNLMLERGIYDERDCFGG